METWWREDKSSSPSSGVCAVQISLHKSWVVGLNVGGNTLDFQSRIREGDELVIVSPISNQSQKISSLIYNLLMEPWWVRSVWFQNPLLCGGWYEKWWQEIFWRDSTQLTFLCVCSCAQNTKHPTKVCYVMWNFGTYFTGTYVFLLMPCESAFGTILLGIEISVLEIRSHC